MYPWPHGDFDNVMDEALDIAMDYLIRTDQAVNFRKAQTLAASAISERMAGGREESIAADQHGDQGGRRKARPIEKRLDESCRRPTPNFGKMWQPRE